MDFYTSDQDQKTYTKTCPARMSCHATQQAESTMTAQIEAGKRRKPQTGWVIDRGYRTRCINLEMGRIFVEGWSFGRCYDDSDLSQNIPWVTSTDRCASYQRR